MTGKVGHRGALPQAAKNRLIQQLSDQESSRAAAIDAAISATVANVTNKRKELGRLEQSAGRAAVVAAVKDSKASHSAVIVDAEDRREVQKQEKQQKQSQTLQSFENARPRGAVGKLIVAARGKSAVVAGSVLDINSAAGAIVECSAIGRILDDNTVFFPAVGDLVLATKKSVTNVSALCFIKYQQSTDNPYFLHVIPKDQVTAGSSAADLFKHVRILRSVTAVSPLKEAETKKMGLTADIADLQTYIRSTENPQHKKKRFVYMDDHANDSEDSGNWLASKRHRNFTYGKEATSNARSAHQDSLNDQRPVIINNYHF